jgi:hypothetical protein
MLDGTTLSTVRHVKTICRPGRHMNVNTQNQRQANAGPEYMRRGASPERGRTRSRRGVETLPASLANRSSPPSGFVKCTECSAAWLAYLPRTQVVAGSNPATPIAAANARRNYMKPVPPRWRAGSNPARRARPGSGGKVDALVWAKALCFSNFCCLGLIASGCVGTVDDRASEARGRKPVGVRFSPAAMDVTNADGSTCLRSPRLWVQLPPA